MIPWYHRDKGGKYESVCRGTWVQIYYNGKYCFAQWEDCGPFRTDDWEYVFGNARPKNEHNKAAGIDISPAVRDYLGITTGTATVHWRFVDFTRVPGGPWAKYGKDNPFVNPALKHAIRKEARAIFLESVHRTASMIAEQLYERYLFQRTALARQFPFMMSNDVWKGGGRLAPNDEVGDVLRQGTLGIGFIGGHNAMVALYGDPAWNVRLAEQPDANDYEVSYKVKSEECVVTIETGPNYSEERLRGADFRSPHVGELPFSFLFPKRLRNPRLADGQSWKAAVDENFLLIYEPNFEPNKKYTITLTIDPLR